MPHHRHGVDPVLGEGPSHVVVPAGVLGEAVHEQQQRPGLVSVVQGRLQAGGAGDGDGGLAHAAQTSARPPGAEADRLGPIGQKPQIPSWSKMRLPAPSGIRENAIGT